MTRDKRIQENLSRHFKLMNELMKKGTPKSEASKKAYDILFKFEQACSQAIPEIK